MAPYPGFSPSSGNRWRKTTKGWEDVWIEFEYRSSTFKEHGHDPDQCDVIVCWAHDWKECPPRLEVIELKREIEKLKARR